MFVVVALHVFGLTGGMGTGKSTVAARFRARGLPVIDSDAVAREVVQPGTEGLAAVEAEFGPALITTEGALDRAAMARLVFTDAAARRRLEGLLHPRIRARTAALLAELEHEREKLACNEVPLLVEVGLTEQLRPLVVVVASETRQLERASRRDGSSREAVAARLASQLPLAEKARLADHVIDNDGDIAATVAQADAVLDRIVAAVGLAADRYPRPATPR